MNLGLYLQRPCLSALDAHSVRIPPTPSAVNCSAHSEHEVKWSQFSLCANFSLRLSRGQKTVLLNRNEKCMIPYKYVFPFKQNIAFMSLIMNKDFFMFCFLSPEQ